MDYLEVHCRPSLLADVSEWFKRYVSERGLSIVFQQVSPTHMSVMLSCRCTPNNSSLRMAETHGVLWMAPVTYLGGEESFDLLVLDHDGFQRLFEDYEKLGDAVIKSKVMIQTNSLKDSFTINLGSLFSSLTQKQVLVLEEAMSRGYYDVPRRTSIREIAGFLGLSEATTQEHLSKAEAKVVRSIAPYLRLYTRSQTYGNPKINDGNITHDQ